jgi:hypothetical protein
MRALVIKNGIVVNAILVESLDVLPNLITDTDSQGKVGNIGDSWNGNTFTTPEPVVPEPVVTPTPTKEELLAQLQALTAKIEALE